MVAFITSLFLGFATVAVLASEPVSSSDAPSSLTPTPGPLERTKLGRPKMKPVSGSVNPAPTVHARAALPEPSSPTTIIIAPSSALNQPAKTPTPENLFPALLPRIINLFDKGICEIELLKIVEGHPHNATALVKKLAASYPDSCKSRSKSNGKRSEPSETDEYSSLLAPTPSTAQTSRFQLRGARASIVAHY